MTLPTLSRESARRIVEQIAVAEWVAEREAAMRDLRAACEKLAGIVEQRQRKARARAAAGGSVVDRLDRLHAARLTTREQSRLLGRLAVVVDDETWQAALDGVTRDRANG